MRFVFFLHLHWTLLLLVHADAGRHARVCTDHRAGVDGRVAHAVMIGRDVGIQRRIGRH